MKILFTGTGTSTGVPQVGCHCPVCKSTDPRDNRLRSAVYITTHNTKLLIDAGPDLRYQCLRHRICSIDAILLTHAHYDHVGGLDDVRPFGRVQIHAESNVLETIRRNMPYCFDNENYPGVPLMELNPIEAGNSFYINDLCIEPLRVMHANLAIIGFRIGNMAYFTDVKDISDETIEKLTGVDTLIFNALRIKKHNSHLSLNESIEIVKRIRPKICYFTHISHDMGLHAEINKLLPENISLAFDGLEIECH